MTRRRFATALPVMAAVFASLGVILTAITLVFGIVVHRQYWFLLTEQFPLSVAAAVAWVSAANCLVWRSVVVSRGPHGRIWPVPGIPLTVALALASVAAAFVLVMVFMFVATVLPRA